MYPSKPETVPIHMFSDSFSFPAPPSIFKLSFPSYAERSHTNKRGKLTVAAAFNSICIILFIYSVHYLIVLTI